MKYEEFKWISNDNIINANNSAIRFLKKVDKLDLPTEEIRKTYFTFMEFHSLIYDETLKDIDYISNRIYTLMDSFEKSFINIFDKNNMIYAFFWNTLITSDKNGRECSVDDFMKNIRMRFGERNFLNSFFENKSKELFPVYEKLKLETYRLEFKVGGFSNIICFTARIPDSEIISILNLKNLYLDDEKLYKKIEIYLKSHNLEYYNYTHQYEKFSNHNLSNIYSYLTTYSDREINEYLKDAQNTYIIVSGGEWSDDWDYYFGCTCVMKRTINENFIPETKIIYQSYEMDDDEEEQWGNFNILKSNLNNKEELVNKNEIIIPQYKINQLDILININDINTIDDIKKYIRK